VQSTLGEGSTFRVRIPLGKAHLPPASIVEEDVAGELASTPAVSDTNSSGRYMDDVVQMIPPSEAGTSSESLTSGSDVLWQPLIFGDRERARIIVADDNAVGIILVSSSLVAAPADAMRCGFVS
jgi:CheY-like chemotaxis protein